jgi:hypothetical protein
MMKAMVFGIVALVLSYNVSQAQLVNDIPNMNCVTALTQAYGDFGIQFMQWYNGYLTGLYSAGERDLAWALYHNPQVVVAQCEANQGLTVYGMLERAKTVLR